MSNRSKQLGTARELTGIAERLWSRILKTSSGCWEWQGYRMPAGYGQIGIDGRVDVTHRVAWSIANGKKIPAGLVVRHKCDNPPCINPAHLELGTHADNVQDAVDRGRVARGFRLPHTRLTEDDVREIRRRYRRFKSPGIKGWCSNSVDLAVEFAVRTEHIQGIVSRRERRNVI